MLLLCIVTNKTIRNEQKMADCLIRRIKLVGEYSQVYKPVPCLSHLWQWIHCTQHLCSLSSCIWRLAHVFSLVTLSPFPHCGIPQLTACPHSVPSLSLSIKVAGVSSVWHCQKLNFPVHVERNHIIRKGMVHKCFLNNPVSIPKFS